jgi:hypothetical protein
MEDIITAIRVIGHTGIMNSSVGCDTASLWTRSCLMRPAPTCRISRDRVATGRER